MISFITGFTASIAHVVSGPDHLAAVTPLAIDSRKKSWFVGLSWGTGHTTGMLMIGLLFVLFKEILPIEAISAHSETAIGILLISIGIWAMIRIYLRHKHKNRPHAHFHTHPYLYAHVHKHEHLQGLRPVIEAGVKSKQSFVANPVLHQHHNDHTHQHTEGFVNHGHSHAPDQVRKLSSNVLTAFSIGVIHGFAGFSHLFALLPSLALPSRLDSVSYVLAFAFGTILTMVGFAMVLGRLANTFAERSQQQFLKWFTFGGALLAIAIGVLWLIHPF